MSTDKRKRIITEQDSAEEQMKRELDIGGTNAKEATRHIQNAIKITQEDDFKQ